MFSFRHIIKIVATVALLSSGISHAALAHTAAVYLAPEVGSWVGGGINLPSETWVHGDDGIFGSGSTLDNSLYGVSIGYQGQDNFSFDFAAPRYNRATNTNDGQPLAVGMYANAQRLPFNSPTKPGMDISGAGRGNNTLSGWFNVLEIGYGANGELSRFAVDFRQYGESTNSTGPSLYGSLRFNSSIALHTLESAVPEPETYAMFLAGLGLIAALARRRKQA